MFTPSKLFKNRFLKKTSKSNPDYGSPAGPSAVGYPHAETEPISANDIHKNTALQTLRQQLQDRETELAHATKKIRQLDGRLSELVQKMNQLNNDKVQEVENVPNTTTDQMERFKQHQKVIEEYLGRNVARALYATPMSPQPDRRMTSGPVPRPDRRSHREYKDPEVGFEWVELDGDESLLVCALYYPKRT